MTTQSLLNADCISRSDLKDVRQSALFVIYVFVNDMDLRQISGWARLFGAMKLV